MPPERAVIGTWLAVRREGVLERPGERVRVEPKVMDLLLILAARDGEVVSHDELMQMLWPGLTVGPDSLPQCVSKLRRLLSDERGRVETIPKRGYRLTLPQVSADPSTEAPRRRSGVERSWASWAAAACGIVLVASAIGAVPAPTADAHAVLLARADDSYMQMRFVDNEAAIQLYRRALERDPRSPRAMAGLANGFTQRALRWPDGREAPRPAGSALRVALESGRLARPYARGAVVRALELAERAAAAAPDDPEVLRALGLALSANRRLPDAAATYDRALAIAPANWGVLINRADLHDLAGEPVAARALLERAYASMDESYTSEAARIRPWQAMLGVGIARRYEAAGDPAAARRWYRRVLADDPTAEEARQALSL